MWQTHMKEKITKLREKLGISLFVFAKTVRSSPTQMRRIVKGEIEVKPELLHNICEAYHVDPRYFEGTIGLDEAVEITDPEKKKKEVGARLRQIRQDRKKTLKELSALIGLSDSQLSLIENGEYNLTERRAKDVARELEVGAEWLLTGNERNKDFPVDEDMVEWLKDHPEERKRIRKKMKRGE